MSNEILDIIRNKELDYIQKKNSLATYAENLLPYVKISENSTNYLSNGIICDLFEGHAPYRPRYILPDYDKYIKTGCQYLNIEPPRDLYEAINALLIMYSYVPSITGYPVFLGNVDEILEPFAATVSEGELEKLMKMFLINIDRTLPDAFVHMDIGPRETIIGKYILKIEKDLKKAIPNISLRYSKETSAQFAKLGVETALEVGKPYFINHDRLVVDTYEDYGIASCYNILRVGGGSHTLIRLNLKKLAEVCKDYNDFIDNKLPKAINCLCEIINARAKFIVEESKFFQSSFLAREGFIDINKFTSMAGVFGLYECVEILSKGLKLGHSTEANKMGENIISKAYELVKAENGEYCNGYGGKIGFHAQSGIDSDIDITAGVRIKIGEEPDIFEQIKTEGMLQKYFDTGVSDIYIFDSTSRNNIDGVLKIIDGAFKNGINIMALNTSDSELVRITGYLVKRSDLDKYFEGQPIREGTVKFGGESIKKNNILNRRVRNISEGQD